MYRHRSIHLTYPPALSVFLHILFWAIIFFLRFIVLQESLTSGRILPTGFSNFCINILAFYGIAYKGIPLLFQKKYLPLLALCIVYYALVTLINYYSIGAYLKLGQINVHSETYYASTNFFQNGLKNAFLGNHPSFYYLFDTFFELLFPLVIKFGKSYYESSIKIITLERDNSLLELNKLKNQLNPHFFFNNLNSIYSLVLQNDARALEAILKLSHLMRRTLYESSSDLILLSNELEHITDYLDLAKIRYGNRVLIGFDTENIGEKDTIPSMLLLNLVENAFKHGVENVIAKTKAWVQISVSVEKSMLYVEIRNNKLPQQPKRAASGIGLQNTQKRLELLYPNRHNLTIVSENELFSVQLTLQL